MVTDSTQKVALEEISTQNGPFNFYSNSMSSCVSQWNCFKFEIPIGLKHFFNINLGIGIIKKTTFLFVFSTFLPVFLRKFRSGELIGCKIKFPIQRVPTQHTFDRPCYPKKKKYLKNYWLRVQGIHNKILSNTWQLGRKIWVALDNGTTGVSYSCELSYTRTLEQSWECNSLWQLWYI